MAFADPLSLSAAAITLPVVIGAGVVALAVGAGGFAAVRSGWFGGNAAKQARSDAEHAKQAYEDKLRFWKNGLAIDRDEIDGFTVSVEVKDHITALRIKGEKTLALYNDVTKARDEIIMGIEGLEARVTKAESIVKKANPPTTATYREALTILNADTTFNAAQVRGILFDAAQNDVAINERTVTQLKAKIEDAKGGWQKIKDAARATLNDVRADFSDKTFLELKTRLTNAGLSEADAMKVLETHPLAKAPETVWERLKALKDGDPVAYLDELRACFKAEIELQTYVPLLIEDYVRAKDAQRRAEGTDRWQKLDDKARDGAGDLMTTLVSLIQSRATADAIDRKATELVAYYEDLIDPRPMPHQKPQSPSGTDPQTHPVPQGYRPADEDPWWDQGGPEPAARTERHPAPAPRTPAGDEKWDVMPGRTRIDDAERAAELRRREEEIRQRTAAGHGGGGYASIMDELMRAPS
jgi:hypothetical protein